MKDDTPDVRKNERRRLNIYLAVIGVCAIALVFLLRQTTATPFVMSWAFVGASFASIAAILLPPFSYVFFKIRRGGPYSRTAYQEICRKYPDPAHLLFKSIGAHLAAVVGVGILTAHFVMLLPPLLHRFVAVPYQQSMRYESTTVRSRLGQTVWVAFSDSPTSSVIRIPANLTVLEEISGGLVLAPGYYYCLHGRTGFAGLAIDRITIGC
jgi:hypothetical protein